MHDYRNYYCGKQKQRKQHYYELCKRKGKYSGYFCKNKAQSARRIIVYELRYRRYCHAQNVHKYNYRKQKNGKYCVVNNTYEPQSTTVYKGDGTSFDLDLAANEIIWYEI